MGGPYPVNFIQVVRLHHTGADDTGTIGSTKFDLHIAEEDVEVGLNGRGIALLADLELGTFGGAVHGIGGYIPSITPRRAISEVGAQGPLVETLVGCAGF